MDHLSPEDFLAFLQRNQSPGAQLYIYRMLHLLASRQSIGGDPVLLSYQAARQLAFQLGVSTREQLVALFAEIGLGRLTMQVDQRALCVSLSRSATPGPGAERCQLERGLIDGSLQQITGIPVTTAETECWRSGSRECRFEATLTESAAGRRFAPPGFETTAPGFEALAAAPRAMAMASGTSPSAEEFSLFAGSFMSEHAVCAPRSWFLDLADRELARARRYGRPLTVLYIDLDDLGRVNQAHGRAAGDQIISAVAAILSRSCRTEDHVWHHGEDEFAAVLCETGTAGAEKVADRLMARIVSASERSGVVSRVSASIGFSSYPSHGEDLTSLLSSARSALYLAKSLGKGRYQAPLGSSRIGAEPGAEPFYTDEEPANEHELHPRRQEDRRRGHATAPGHLDSPGGEDGRPRGAQKAADRRATPPHEEPFTDGKSPPGHAAIPMDQERDANGLRRYGHPASSRHDTQAGDTVEETGGTVEEAGDNAAATALQGSGAHGGEIRIEDPGSGERGPSESREIQEGEAGGDSQEARISILLASESPLLLTGMKGVISDQSDMMVTSEVKNPARALTVVRDMRPELVFADMKIATANDFALSRLLRDENLPCKLAVFPAELDQDVLKLATDFSVDGVILQQSGASEVIKALKTIYRGKTVLPDEARAAISELEENRRLLGDLSERELEVLRLVAEGKSNSQISEQLFITVNTVRFHLANVYQKLGVSNRTGAANYYLRQDLAANAQTKLL